MTQYDILCIKLEKRKEKNTLSSNSNKYRLVIYHSGYTTKTDTVSSSRCATSFYGWCCGVFCGRFRAGGLVLLSAHRCWKNPDDGINLYRVMTTPAYALGLFLVGQYQPQSVDYTGNSEQKAKHDIQPEVQTDTHLQKCGDGRKKDSQQDLDDFHNGSLLK